VRWRLIKVFLYFDGLSTLFLLYHYIWPLSYHLSLRSRVRVKFFWVRTTMAGSVQCRKSHLLVKSLHTCTGRFLWFPALEIHRRGTVIFSPLSAVFFQTFHGSFSAGRPHMRRIQACAWLSIEIDRKTILCALYYPLLLLTICTRGLLRL